MTTVSELKAVFTAETSNFQAGAKSVKSEMEGITQRANTLSPALRQAFTTGATAAAAAGAALVQYGINIQSTMANTRAIMGLTREETQALQNSIARVSNEFRATPAQAANAYYDVASGVADASKHMDILRASMALADAGQADLTTTTAGLVAAMNAYNFNAQDAGKVSDVFSQTVAKGVGTMDQFVSAMSPIMGLANQVGVSIEELGAAMAYSTAKGATASQSATQLQAAMVALIRPNTRMTQALQTMGFASGTAAVDSLGLVGALTEVNAALGGNEAALAEALGSVEALRGVLALTGEGYTEFFDSYSAGLDGATSSARAAQLDTVAAKFDMIQGKAQTAGLAILDASNALHILGAGLDSANMLFDIAGIVADPSSVQSAAQGALDSSLTQSPSVTKTVDITFEPGDTVWSISEETGIDQQAIIDALAAQGITDTSAIPSGVTVTLDIGVEGVPTMGMGEFRIFDEWIVQNQQAQEEMTRTQAVTLLLQGTLREMTGTDYDLSGLVAGFNEVAGVVDGLLEKVGGLDALLKNVVSAMNPITATLRAGEIVSDTITGEPMPMGMAAPIEPRQYQGSMMSVTPGIYNSVGMGNITDASAEAENLRTSLEEPIAITVTDQNGISFQEAIAGFASRMTTATQNRTVVVDVIPRLLWRLEQDAADAAMSSVTSTLGGMLPGRAGGGAVMAGQPYIVGEVGPELFVPSVNGQIVPTDALMRGGGGGVTININGSFYGDQQALLSAVEQAMMQRGY